MAPGAEGCGGPRARAIFLQDDGRLVTYEPAAEEGHDMQTRSMRSHSISPTGSPCATSRSAPAMIVRTIVGALALVGLAAVVMIVANAREPYGGPLEA